jgi:GGDEF domain-containing protein
MRDGQLAYELAPDGLTAPERAGELEAKKGRDEAVNAVQPGSVAQDIDDLRVLLGEDRFKKFKKVAFLDPLTQTRQYDFVRAEAPEWNKKYARHGNASLISARGLKVINDALGHEAGDRYLTALGRELRKIVIDQRASGNWLEDAARIASKDFLIVGKDSGKVSKALDAAMRKVMAGDEVLDAEQKAKVSELARTRGEDPAMTGTLRAVKTNFAGGKGQADLFGTIDKLIELSDAAKQQEQPAPPPPPVVNSK